MREQILQDIIDLETAMFCSLNIGEPMPEDRIKPFRLMRWMTYSVLADDTLASWLSDLRAAKQAGASADWDPKRLLPRAGSPGVATDAGASFGIGGQATTEAASSQRADVGAKAGLQFED